MSAGGQRHVYFIVGAGKTKIGVTEHPVARLASLQSSCPVPLRLIHFERGDVGLERALHTLLAARRAHGEWFEGEISEAEAIRAVDEAKRVRPDTRYVLATAPAKPRTRYPLATIVRAAQQFLDGADSMPLGKRREAAKRMRVSADYPDLPPELQERIAAHCS